MRRAAVAAFFLFSFAAGKALGQEVDAGAPEIDTLVARIDVDLQRAQTEDCTIACSALQSMMRSTDRLCSIDPDLRCRSAREKVKGAVERVRTFCPECVPPSIGAAEVPRAAPAPPPGMAPVEQAVPRRGGCAGCATASSDDTANSALGFALAALVIAYRRRLKRRDR